MNGNKEKIAYKVVRVVNKSGTVFKPATYFALQRIRYKLNEWTERNNCGSFCLFSTYKEAKSFWRSLPLAENGYAILECKYIPSEIPSFPEYLPEVFVWKKASSKRCIRADRSLGIKYMSSWQLPKGTVLADAVYPVKIRCFLP